MAADQARFTLKLSAARNLSNATVTVRLAKFRGTGGTIMAYAQEGGPNFAILYSAPFAISSLASSMQDVVLNVSAATGTANRAAIERIGVQISGAGSGALSNPTVIYVDRVDVANSSPATGSFTFDTSDSVYTTATSDGPSSKIWLNSFSEDTNVSGAAVGWLGP
jgi:type II secretory pathway pseudopilin PulG